MRGKIYLKAISYRFSNFYLIGVMFLCIIQIVITKRLLDLKPENVDSKSAYLIGSGLASLAAACF